jgi:STE24 endopeptidase
VLHHVLYGLVELLVQLVVLLLLLRVWLESLQRRRGARWGSSSVDDLALLPAALLIVGVLSLLSTPLTNTLTRLREREADRFGLNASRQPDGFAQAMLKLGQYRKLSPGPVEEAIFFDHPSGATRILDAMRWKRENRGVSGYE